MCHNGEDVSCDRVEGGVLYAAAVGLQHAGGEGDRGRTGASEGSC